MMRYHTVLLAVGLLLSGSSAMGAEADPGTRAESENGQEQTARTTPRDSQKPAETKKQTSKNKSKDKEIFIPSEEISEDFAVSFPVDI